jgi:hypothetical protein
MAFSIEAALVLPITMTLWIGLLSAAAPEYALDRKTAGLAVETACFGLENRYLYKSQCFGEDGVRLTGLQVSPQTVLEICSLIKDDFRLVSSFTDGKKSAGIENNQEKGHDFD